MTTSVEAKNKRPLSPHLQVYRLPFNANMSIIGRAVGIALALSLSVILSWFVVIVWNPAFYDTTMNFLNAPVIAEITKYKLLLGAFVVFFYLGNGVRHVLWDMVIGVNVKSGIFTGRLTLIIAALLTLGVWMIANCQTTTEEPLPTTIEELQE